MKITTVTIHVARPFERSPFGDHHPAYVFVQIDTDEGLTGCGECSNWPHGSDLIVAAAAREMGRGLIGTDPARIERNWLRCYRGYTYVGSRGVITNALSGIDMALWDLRGKALGQPVHQLLGGVVHEPIRLYTHPGSGPESTADKIVALQQQGWVAFKFDPFSEMGPRHLDYIDGYITPAGLRAGAEVVAAVREAAGPDAEIMIDLHGQYNVESAVRVIDAIAPYRLTWIEEPVPPDSVDALAQVRRRVDVPLCVGERLHTRYDFVPVLSRGLADFVMPDVSWSGGISELRKIATLAEAYLVPIAPHGACGPLQTLAGAQVMAVTPNFYRLEVLGPDTLELYDQALTRPLPIRDGHLHLDATPGLGADLDLDYLAAHAHPEWAG